MLQLTRESTAVIFQVWRLFEGVSQCQIGTPLQRCTQLWNYDEIAVALKHEIISLMKERGNHLKYSYRVKPEKMYKKYIIEVLCIKITEAMARKLYPTHLTDQQWHILKPLIPTSKAGGRSSDQARDSNKRVLRQCQQRSLADSFFTLINSAGIVPNSVWWVTTTCVWCSLFVPKQNLCYGSIERTYQTHLNIW